MLGNRPLGTVPVGAEQSTVISLAPLSASVSLATGASVVKNIAVDHINVTTSTGVSVLLNLCPTSISEFSSPSLVSIETVGSLLPFNISLSVLTEIPIINFDVSPIDENISIVNHAIISKIVVPSEVDLALLTNCNFTKNLLSQNIEIQTEFNVEEKELVLVYGQIVNVLMSVPSLSEHLITHIISIIASTDTGSPQVVQNIIMWLLNDESGEWNINDDSKEWSIK